MSAIVWRKASRSNEHGGACIEVAELPGAVGVRDSKDPDGPQLVVSREAFGALAAALGRQVE
ncbi:DUF397 domain-containing protein [Actinomadura rugatobispora]|uniref:DUF397 domain-containing protein n=1 Tax=Actinomadura rugatobispora TaxID=1994 RepID=A0ABW1A287_9ACTN|nr:hypothetical protein GCM10010200_039160 [Actinomadura rugatobispora]